MSTTSLSTPPTSTMSTRLLLGFVAGFFSNLIFQDGLLGILYAAHLVPALGWSLMPVPPLGVPQSLNLAFWAGLWGMLYALLEPRLTARLGWWLGGLVFGLAPLAVYWFVVLPLKGFGIGGGFQPARVLLSIALHTIYGLGAAILFRFGLVFTRRRIGASPGVLHG
jgi:hypothetical protein